jgi:hypothetical protein
MSTSEQARSEVIRSIHRNPGSPARELCALGWKEREGWGAQLKQKSRNSVYDFA